MQMKMGSNAPKSRKRWGALAAGVACLIIVGSGGYAIAAAPEESACPPGGSLLVPKVAMNVGGPEVIVDGKTWSADQYGSGGHVWTNLSNTDVAGTELDQVYKSERAAKQLTYNIPVDNGTYLVRLHLAEIHWGAPGGSAAGAKPGKRVESFNVEGGFPEVRGLDPAVAANGTMKAIAQGVEATVTDGKLTVVGYGHTDFAALQGLEALLIQPCSDKGKAIDAEPVAPSQPSVTSDPSEEAAPPVAEQPTDQPTDDPTESENEVPAPVTPSAAPPAVETKGVVMAANKTPIDPSAERVVSPNPSPVAKAANLKGPRIRISCGDTPEKLNGINLAAGTVVEFERGCQWMNVRVVVSGSGSAAQPILLTAVGDPTKPAPVLGAQKAGREKDDGILSLEGAYMHVSGLAFKDSGSIAIGANGANGVLDNIEASKVVSGAWIRGDGTKVWNSYMHDLVLMGDTPGDNDDYGANGLTVEANNVVVEGLTCRRCLASSPDYDQYGGDGSFVEVWNKGDNLKISYGYVDSSARVLEAGGLQGTSANNMSLRYVFAKGITDQPIYLNESGDYSRITTSGFTQANNSINK